MRMQRKADTLTTQVHGESRDVCYSMGMRRLADGLGWPPDEPPEWCRVELSLELEAMIDAEGEVLTWQGTMTATVEEL